jgi:hypothetical protein
MAAAAAAAGGAAGGAGLKKQQSLTCGWVVGGGTSQYMHVALLSCYMRGVPVTLGCLSWPLTIMHLQCNSTAVPGLHSNK